MTNTIPNKLKKRLNHQALTKTIFNFNTVNIKIANAHRVNSSASFVGTTYVGLQRHLFKENHKNESHWQPNLYMIQSCKPQRRLI